MNGYFSVKNPDGTYTDASNTILYKFIILIMLKNIYF